MRKLFYTIFLLGLYSSAMAQEGNIKFSEYDLPNGLHVILQEDHTTPNVCVSVLYHVGSKNEDPNRTGFAHFFEHLLFEGTDQIGRGEYMKLVQSNGGMVNANTSFDRTYYFEVMPSNFLELALWMESDRMQFAKIDSIGLATQREVVKEEKRLRYENTPYGRLIEQIYKRAFKVHPYRWMPIGEAQYIDQATLPEFLDFYHTFYVPNNATLSISGDLNIEQAKTWISKYFSPIPKGVKEIPRPTVIEPKWEAEQVDTFYDNVQLPAIVAAYHIPAQDNPDFYAMDMLSTLLSNGKSSRMYRSMVEGKEIALQAASFSIPTENPGLSIMFAIAKPGIGDHDIINAIDAEVKRVQTEQISEEEFKKLRNMMEDNFASQAASIRGVAENLANYHVYYGNANLINQEVNRYLSVTKEDIQRVANQYLVPSNRVVLYYLPK